MAEAANQQEFEALLKKAENGRSVVDFYATWCPPCKRIGPYIEQKCKAEGVQLIKVDVDKNGTTASKYGIKSMPTFKVIDKTGKVIA